MRKKNIARAGAAFVSVSYTHLDVYKRQAMKRASRLTQEKREGSYQGNIEANSEEKLQEMLGEAERYNGMLWQTNGCLLYTSI